jgi:hypothetical protein
MGSEIDELTQNPQLVISESGLMIRVTAVSTAVFYENQSLM